MFRANLVVVILLTVLVHGVASGQVFRGSVVGSTGPSGVNSFGTEVVTIDDVDGDGTKDIAVSDPTYFATPNFIIPANGRAWIYSGNTRQVIAILDPASGTNGFASTIRSAGDANGDGRGDIIVGTLVPTLGPAIANKRLLSIQPASTLRTFTPPTLTFSSGYFNVWSIGDRNGDGRGDVAVRYTTTSPIYGGLTSNQVVGLNVTETLSFEDAINPGYFGATTSGGTICNVPGFCAPSSAGQFALDGIPLGDLDGDGLDESIYGSRTPTINARIQLSSSGTTRIHPIPWSRFARFDDLDGDGVGDYGIFDLGSLPSANPSFLNVFSGATGSPVYVKTFAGGEVATTMADVHGVGDVDRDGLGDYAVSDVTAAYLLRVYSGRDGSEIMTVAPPPSMTFRPNFDHLGDIDGDGIQEIVIGDRNLPQAYVYSLVPSGVTYFGTGCPSIGGVGPTLGVTGQALAGSGVDFHLGNVPPFGLGVLIIGVSNTFWGPIILPYDLGVIGLPGCDLLVSADFLDFALIDAVGQKGTASFGYTFAAGLPLTGFTFFGQWFVENPPGSPVPYQMSNAASVTFQ